MQLEKLEHYKLCKLYDRVVRELVTQLDLKLKTKCTFILIGLWNQFVLKMLSL